MTEHPLRGKVYHIQGFSVQDGPGIRTTVFLKGCPLRCPWCHSPESQEFFTELNWMAMRCLGTEACGKCISQCPAGALSQAEPAPGADLHLVRKDLRRCIGCGQCADVCLPEAIYRCGKDYTVSELADLAEQDRSFFERSGGGVTLSGGEPLSQPEFAVAFLRECRRRGLHTALDTTGYAPPQWIDAALEQTDLFLYDLKHMDSKKHQQTVGVPNEQILENVQRIARSGGRLQIRIPVIPGFNDGEENLRAAGSFLRTLGSAVTLVQLLPYHNMGSTKYERVQRPYLMWDTVAPTEQFMNQCRLLLEEYGLAVEIH